MDGHGLVEGWMCKLVGRRSGDWLCGELLLVLVSCYLLVLLSFDC